MRRHRKERGAASRELAGANRNQDATRSVLPFRSGFTKSNQALRSTWALYDAASVPPDTAFDEAREFVDDRTLEGLIRRHGVRGDLHLLAPVLPRVAQLEHQRRVILLEAS